MAQEQELEEQAAEASASYTPLTADAGIIFFRPAALDDLDACFALEIASYPPDEAATLEKLKFRIEHAGTLFLVAVRPGGPQEPSDRIVGFTCGTSAVGDNLTHASMSTHQPEGTLLCVHSVVVAEELRRQGIATRMLKAYLQFVQAANPHLQRAALLCKDNLVKLYAGAGFELVGPSDVVHGADLWFEMQQPLGEEG